MSLAIDILSSIGVVICLLLLYLKSKFSYWKDRKVPHEPPTFLFGNMYDVFVGKLTVGHQGAKICQKFPNEPYFGFYSLWKPLLMLKDHEIIKQIIVKDFDKFRNTPFASDERADPIAAHMLLGMKDGRWKNMRSKLTPIFTSGKLKLMLPLLKECAGNLVSYFKKNLDETLEMKSVVSKYTVDSIASVGFGINANSFAAKSTEFLEAGRRIFSPNLSRSLQTTAYFFNPTLVSLFKLKFIDPIAGNFLRNVFWETFSSRESGKTQPRNDLIDLLINLKNTHKELLDGDALPAQAITFFAAGHEATSSAISFTVFELCLNKAIQKKLREEVLESIKKHGDLTYEGFQEMKYLHMVVSETLRKYPFAPFVGRVAAENYKLPGHDLVIEKGMTVFLPLHGLHYDPKFFPNPEKYDPERFNEENRKKIPQFAYMPFGEGPRICIGERFGILTTKVALAYIVKEFEIIKSEKTPDKLIFNPRAPLLTPIDGVPVKLKIRKSLE